MKTWLGLLLAIGIADVSLDYQVAQGEEHLRTKVLLIGKRPDHPWGTHMYMYTNTMLSKCLQRTEGVETVVSEGWPEEEAALNDVATIVVYSSPAAEYLLDSPGRDRLDQMMRSGVGLVTIHWASSVYEKNFERLGPRWIQYMGGVWISNYGLSTDKSRLEQLDPSHPICRGWTPYPLHDEFYLRPTIKDAKPLLQVITKDQPVIVGWTHERSGNGRSFATTLGHFYRNFQIDSFRRMIVNAILWTAHREVPENGAPIDVDSAILALPAKPGVEN